MSALVPLIRGVRKFQEEVHASRREFFEKLAAGQRPRALFITCSDSRVDPNLLTQTAPGELFILRNAGNIVPAFGLAVGGVTATIEYAVRALEVGEIIVCGHSNCGAMGGVLFPEKVAKLRSVASWLRFGEPARLVVERNHAHLSGDELLRVLTEQNVIAQMNNLRTHPSVAAGLAAGSLRVHGWTYDLKTGEVREYAAGEGEFRPLGSASGEDVDQELPAAVAQG